MQIIVERIAIFDSVNSGGCIFQLLWPAMNSLTHLIAHAEEVPSSTSVLRQDQKYKWFSDSYVYIS
jgi:hypothetical protein